MANTEKSLDIVNDLIEACRDSQQGYKDAAEHAKNTSLRTYFNERSLERARFGSELQIAGRRLGVKEIKESGSVAGTIRRAWMDLKANLGGGDQSILNSLEAAEDTVKRAYQDAMSANLPGDLVDIVRIQAQTIFSTHDYIRSLRDQQKAA